VVIDNHERLAPHYVIPLVDRALADKLINKTDFYATCAALGVPHPITTVVTPTHRNDPSVGEGLGFDYPVILKPSNTDIYPRLHFEGKEKVYLVPDAAALRATAEMIFAAGYDDDLIVQEFIPGDETVMRVANTYSDREGVLKFVSVGQVLLADHDPEMVGNNNAILSVHDEDLTASLTTLLNSVGYTGMANVDLMYDRRDGTNKLLELNLRLGATSHYVMAAGGNIVAAMIEDRIRHTPLDLTVTTHERLWLNLPYAIALLLTPRSLRKRVRAARRAGSRHTLWYRPDMSLKRFVTVVRVDLRYTVSSLRFARHGMNR
jgi:D-aspartate ligase